MSYIHQNKKQPILSPLLFQKYFKSLSERGLPEPAKVLCISDNGDDIGCKLRILNLLITAKYLSAVPLSDKPTYLEFLPERIAEFSL